MNIKKIRFKNFIKVGVIILLVAVLFSINMLERSALKASGRGSEAKKPIYYVDRADNKIAISFDAAWGADKTEGILDVMDEFDISCTFFLVAFWAEKYPELVTEIINRGHEIGTHSSTHPHFNSLSEEKKRLELTDSVQRIESVSKRKITLFRPPFGEYDNALIKIANNLSLDVIQWDVDSLDWKGISSDEISKRILTKTKSGSIILCHNNGDNTILGVKKAISKLIERGYEFVKISELIYPSPYNVDVSGAQKKC